MVELRTRQKLFTCRNISSPSPNGSPHLVHLAQVGWKWLFSPAWSTLPEMKRRQYVHLTPNKACGSRGTDVKDFVNIFVIKYVPILT
jgi:hypothetical protein